MNKMKVFINKTLRSKTIKKLYIYRIKTIFKNLNILNILIFRQNQKNIHNLISNKARYKKLIRNLTILLNFKVKII